jgi:hypothetical protein
MDDEESASATPPAWASLPFDSLIHIKNSLDDAVDSMTQLLADDAVAKLTQRSPHVLTLTMLLQPLGCWLAENDVDESVYARNHLKKGLCNVGSSRERKQLVPRRAKRAQREQVPGRARSKKRVVPACSKGCASSAEAPPPLPRRWFTIVAR